MFSQSLRQQKTIASPEKRRKVIRALSLCVILSLGRAASHEYDILSLQLIFNFTIFQVQLDSFFPIPRKSREQLTGYEQLSDMPHLVRSPLALAAAPNITYAIESRDIKAEAHINYTDRHIRPFQCECRETSSRKFVAPTSSYLDI